MTIIQSIYKNTLKSKFTPDRLIKILLRIIYVDVITTDQITLGTSITNLTIDGVRILEGHRVLVKNQRSIEYYCLTLILIPTSKVII
jgi:hypothetical protein